VPPPPQIGDRQYQANNPQAYFNRLTLTGIDKLEPSTYQGPDGRQWSVTDYLQFVNPGDLRVVGNERGCGMGGCHLNQHAQWMAKSPIATTTGLLSGARYSTGVDNRVPANNNINLDGNSLADSAVRAVSNPAFNPNNRGVGEVGAIPEVPELAQYNGPMRDNGNYTAANLNNHIIDANQDPASPNRVRAGSPLEALIDEQMSITCGDCHLNSAGANNRFGDFRSSGCTACHMEYSPDGRSRSGDPNVNRFEPANPDQIQAPERAHVASHQIRNVAKILPNGAFVRGISDNACVGCHQGSNRTVLQFWGIRLDQNADLTNDFQYPANANTFTDGAADPRLFDPAVNNQTFNGRAANQLIALEDYDGDNRDDTPPDVHHEAGMGCIDCHGSRDLHNGTKDDPSSGKIKSRMSQVTTIQCQSCHGGNDALGAITEASTAACEDYAGQPSQCAVDKAGNPLKHVTKDGQGNFWLISRLTGDRHYVPQVPDVLVNNNKRNPQTQQLLYNPKASYAMGKPDGNPATGIGPVQGNPNLISPQFGGHMDSMDCQSCHASWTNNCIGCHLKTQYDVDPNNYFFSNITGERILLFQANADFVYQSPVMMYLGVNSHGRITQLHPGDKWFYRYEDYQGNESDVFTFSDRLGEGNNPASGGRNAFPAVQFNQMAPHSIRGKVTATNEGARYCVACHLNVDQLNNFGAEYDAFRAAYQNNDFANLDFDLLQQHIGQNTGNQLNSPFFVHMAAGLGTGLFLFDANGCPVNPLDENPNRQNCGGEAPADLFNVNNVAYDLDRMVEYNGVPNGGNTHPMEDLAGTLRRTGATNPQMGGPLSGALLQKLADPNTGRVLDSWLDADGNPQGNAANYVQ
jgi:hypothetical protein